MGLIPNPIYWQNLPPTTLTFQELGKVIRPILDTLYTYLKNISENSPIISVHKKNIGVAHFEAQITDDLEKSEKELLISNINKQFLSNNNYTVEGKNYQITEHIGHKNQVLIQPNLFYNISVPILLNNRNYNISIIPSKGNYIEFKFQSDDQKLSVKKSLQHNGKLKIFTVEDNAKQKDKQKERNYDQNLKMIQYFSDENAVLVEFIEMQEDFQIKVEPNVSVIVNKIRAIQSFIENPKPYYFPILKLFEKHIPNSIDQDKLSFDFRIPPDSFKYLNNDRYPGVDQQREFVNIALNTHDFAILEGPPGSGKTTTILEILHQATKANQRVLMVASTHIAVDNILERIDEERDKGEELQIFPIRIGKIEDVQGEAVNYVLENAVREEKNRIINYIKKKGTQHLSGPQKKILNILETGESTPIFENFLLDIANVICGTTIGILHYPAFERDRFSISEPFDILIIDEASKTTLQEFLVPALLAKKWIIVGDKMQLSPFIEEGEIRTLKDRCFIEGNFGEEHNWLCTEFFGALNSNLVITDTRSVQTEINEHIKCITQEGIVVFDPLNPVNSTEDIANIIQKQSLQILGCTGGLIDYHCFLHENHTEITEFFPPDLGLKLSSRLEDELSSEQFKKLSYFCLKHNRSLDYYLKKNTSGINKNSKVKPWIEEISWRLKRIYELRHQAQSDENKTLYRDTESEVENLLPKWNLLGVTDIQNCGEYALLKIKNALRIKVNNILEKYEPYKIELIKQFFKENLSNITSPIDYFQLFLNSAFSRSSEEDKSLYLYELVWDILSKDPPNRWIHEFYLVFPKFFEDLLTYQIGNQVFDILRIEFPSIIELLQEGLMIEPKYRNVIIYNCTVYKGYKARPQYWQSREIKLIYQHRMHSDISKFVSENFYEGKQVLSPDGSNNTYRLDDERQFSFCSGPRNIWYNVQGDEIATQSYKNLREIESLYKIYCEFEKWAEKNPKSRRYAKDNGIWEVAIITFYIEQGYEISAKFQEHFKPKIGNFNFKDEKKNIKVKIGTVDGFQGQEADIVLVSFVRTEKIGFLDSRNRLNVALSRAKYLQVLFGDVNFFKSSYVKKRSPILYELATKIPHGTII